MPSGASASASAQHRSFGTCNPSPMYGARCRDATGYLSRRAYPPPLPHNSHSPFTIAMAPMSVVEQADRLLQEAIDQFRDKKSIMKSEYRNLAESHMIW